VSLAPVYDAIGVNSGNLPQGAIAAGYTTGSGAIPWTQSEWAQHPNAIRICQNASASDTTADVLDIERGAATIQDATAWFWKALNNFGHGIRPDQRYPCFYISASSVSGLINSLIASGVTSGPKLWIANWNLTPSQAAVMVTNAGGPFPVVGVQYKPGSLFDTSIFTTDWLDFVSAPSQSTPPPPVTPVYYGGNTMMVQDEHGSAYEYMLGRKSLVPDITLVHAYFDTNPGLNRTLPTVPGAVLAGIPDDFPTTDNGSNAPVDAHAFLVALRDALPAS
jgi:hypothetical protein